MGRYELLIRPSVTKDVRGIPGSDLRKILARIESLRDDPRPAGCVRLSGSECYRIRQGDYRIVYEIHDDRVVVIVVRVGHRRDVYRSQALGTVESEERRKKFSALAGSCPDLPDVPPHATRDFPRDGVPTKG